MVFIWLYTAKRVLQELQDANFDLSLPGFDADELDKLLNGEAEEITEGET